MDILGVVPASRSFNLRVIGVGGAGCNAVGQLAKQPMAGVELILVNTDAAALARSSLDRRFVIGEGSMRGLGAGGDPERGRLAAEEDLALIRRICEGAEVVFVVAGMGGGTGTGAAPVIARVAKESGALVIGIVMMPFDCEGLPRRHRATEGLRELTAAADTVIRLQNQEVLKLIDEKTSLLDAFKLTNEWVAQGVGGVWRMLAKPGLINVDFADLCAVFRGRHAESSLVAVEARGENRAAVVLERLLAHPLVDQGTRLNDATQVLVCIAGGSELSLRDVNHILEQIRRHAEQALLVMGAAIEDDFQDRIAVTLVASAAAPTVAVSPEAAPTRSTAPSSSGPETSVSSAGVGQPEDLLLRQENLEHQVRVPSRFVAPPPESSPEMIQAMANQTMTRGKRKSDVWKQGTLNLEIVSKGRFEKSEPTIHHGQDLDIPTFVRRGVVLN